MAQAAIAEAGLMTGMENNADLVRMASFAPLMMNINHLPIDGANVLVFYDTHRYAAEMSHVTMGMACLSSVSAAHHGVCSMHTNMRAGHV